VGLLPAARQAPNFDSRVVLFALYDLPSLARQGQASVKAGNKRQSARGGGQKDRVFSANPYLLGTSRQWLNLPWVSFSNHFTFKPVV